MQASKNGVAPFRPGWTCVAVSAVLFAGALVSGAVVIGALVPSLNGLPTASSADLTLVAPCIMVGLATGTLGFFVARGSIPGRTADEWHRGRGIVLATFGIVCGLWATGPTLLLVSELREGRWNVPLLVDVLIPTAVFISVRWSWPESFLATGRNARVVKGDV